MQENEIISDGFGLTKLVAELDKINSQCIPLFRNDTYKIKLLSIAVNYFTWKLKTRNNELNGNFNY